MINVKIVLTAISVSLLGTSVVFSQDSADYMQKKIYVGVGTGLVLPTESFNKTNKIGLDYNLFLGVPLSSNFAITAQYGGFDLKGKSIESVHMQDYSTSYLAVGGTYRLDKLFKRVDRKTSFNVFANIGGLWDKNNVIQSNDTPAYGEVGIDWVFHGYSKRKNSFGKIGFGLGILQYEKSDYYFPKLSISGGIGFFERKKQ